MIHRLLPTIACDVRLQARNGFYHAAAFVALCWIVGLHTVPADILAWLLPVLVLSNMLINTFYFVAGLVLLEKGEGTLMARVTSPLLPGEYLASKVMTLALLSIVENGMIILFVHGTDVAVLPLLAGMSAAAALYTLAGIWAVVRYDSINEFLFPSFLMTMVFVPPFLHYLDLWNGPLVYLHPLQAALVLTKAGFLPVPTGELLYGVLYSGIAIFLMVLWTRGRFLRFIVMAEGTR